MSTSLYWLPPPEAREETDIYNLKWVIAQKMGEHDGSVGEDLGYVNADFIPFLEGVVVGNGGADMSKDAQSLIDGIKKHGRVQLIIHS